MMFTNQYIGFDALFIDYYTNSRFEIAQESEADIIAFKNMERMGLLKSFTLEKYRQTLRVIQDEEKYKSVFVEIKRH